MSGRIGLAVVIVAFPLGAARSADPDVPKAIAVPAGHKLLARVEARGVQVYKAVEGKGGGLLWVLEGPLAELTDGRGGKAGYHYDGPAWEAADGSQVIRDASEPVLSAPAPDPKANIPWLLVKVKAADDKPGMFAQVVYIQRVDTVGGKAPADSPKRPGTRVGVSYKAAYLLWVKEAR